jgi:hypothetical protein
MTTLMTLTTIAADAALLPVTAAMVVTPAHLKSAAAPALAQPATMKHGEPMVRAYCSVTGTRFCRKLFTEAEVLTLYSLRQYVMLTVSVQAYAMNQAVPLPLTVSVTIRAGGALRRTL